MRIVNQLVELSTFAHEIAALVTPQMEIALLGDLGAGKTTLVRALAQALAVKESVTSPSFVLEHRYHCPQFEIEHWDLYRLNCLPEELLEPVGAETLRIIEWADKFPTLLERCQLVIQIEIPDLLAQPELRHFQLKFQK